MSPNAVQSRISFIHLAQLTPFRAALSAAVLELGHDTRPVSANVLNRLGQAAAAEQGLHAAAIEEILAKASAISLVAQAEDPYIRNRAAGMALIKLTAKVAAMAPADFTDQHFRACAAIGEIREQIVAMITRCLTEEKACRVTDHEMMTTLQQATRRYITIFAKMPGRGQDPLFTPQAQEPLTLAMTMAHRYEGSVTRETIQAIARVLRAIVREPDGGLIACPRGLPELKRQLPT